MKIILLLEDIILNIAYAALVRLVPPANEQEALALSEMIYRIILDPLDIFKKGNK